MGVSLFLFLVIRFFLRHLPLRIALGCGRFLGTAVYYLLPVRRRVVRDQLRRALGQEKSSKELRQIARSVYQNLGQNLVEFLRFDSRDTLVVDVAERAKIDALLAQGRRLIVLTAHVGAWDLLCSSQALAGYPLAIVSKTIRPEALNRYWMKTRKQANVTILTGRHLRAQCREQLAQGKILGIVLDQHCPSSLGGIPTTFFGQTAYTASGLAKLADETNATVVPVFLVRTQEGHRMIVGDVIPFAAGNTEEERIAATTQAYTDAIEKQIREYPDQWFWLHRRWKTPPKA